MGFNVSYIFYCNDRTEQESFQKGVFGNVYKHWDTVRKIKPGSPIFLINLNTGTLYGPFQSKGKPQLYLDPYVFVESGRNYPAQVEVTWGRVMKINRVFSKFRFLRKELRCRLKPSETVRVFMGLVEEQNGKIHAWA